MTLPATRPKTIHENVPAARSSQPAIFLAFNQGTLEVSNVRNPSAQRDPWPPWPTLTSQKRPRLRPPRRLVEPEHEEYAKRTCKTCWRCAADNGTLTVKNHMRMEPKTWRAYMARQQEFQCRNDVTRSSGVSKTYRWTWCKRSNQLAQQLTYLV